MKRLSSLLSGSRSRLALAAGAGFATVAAGAGLLATGAFLIARADQHPPILDLTLAIVGVRFFGISRAALRYGERLVAHDAALRLVARLRAAAAAAVERLAPGGIEDDARPVIAGPRHHAYHLSVIRAQTRLELPVFSKHHDRARLGRSRVLHLEMLGRIRVAEDDVTVGAVEVDRLVAVAVLDDDVALVSVRSDA